MSVCKPSRQPDEPQSLQIFTLEIDGRPTLVFEAMGLAEASGICLDADLRSDLRALTSDGTNLRRGCKPQSPAGNARGNRRVQTCR